jgi:dTDP-glucose pyrophosphorylase
VAEKRPISDIATCGVYWYRKGSDFVKYAKEMIKKDIRVNNEFYVAPVYNELIKDGKNIIPFFVEKMWGLGTPEDLNIFLKGN